MILDATAGNRVMWKNKENDQVIYIDVQKQLDRKPTIIADNTRSPFPNKIFDTIFFDPPHAWNAALYGIPNMQLFKKKYPNSIDDREAITYYGLERYKTKTALISHIFKAQREFSRILKDNGMLWVKWNDMRIPLSRILTIFSNWAVQVQIEHSSEHRSPNSVSKGANSKTFWVALMKKQQPLIQTALA